MNVNCKVSLTDEQRVIMYQRLTGKNGKGMVSRADVNTFVKDRIEKFLNGVDTKSPLKLAPPNPILSPEPHEFDEPPFKPTRGDEPYMFKAKDESLRAIHTRMLDCIEEYERAVWEEMEKNRK